VPLPIGIGLSLAAAGLKIFGGGRKLVEFAQHPLDIAAGHLAGESILKLAERLREWSDGNPRIENQDLDKALARSALLANLFCLLDALPPQPYVLGPWSELRERCKKWLPRHSLQGIFSQAEEAVILPAIETCEKRLKEVEEGSFAPAEIDPLRLVLTDRGRDWGATLAREALADLQREHPNLQDGRLKTIFEERWFPYLCLAFQDRIKSDARVCRIFLTMQIATGFLSLDEALREFRVENRELSKEILAQLAVILEAIRAFGGRRSPAAPVNPFASVRAPAQAYVERPQLQEHLRGLLLGSAGRAVALTALQGMGGIGKTELARKLCHNPEVRQAFCDGIVWMDIGRESGRTILDRMKEVAEKLNDDPVFYTAGNCETRYRSVLAGKAILLVLDDVWSEGDVVPFIPDSPRCRLLFTTRIASIAAETGAADCTADLLSEPQARAVMAEYAGLSREELPPESAEIIAECGRLPKGLSEIGALLRGKPRERWADVLEKLRSAGVEKLLAPTAVSVEEMGREDPALRERYLQLAVLLEDMAAPEPVLRTLWDVDARTARDNLGRIGEPVPGTAPGPKHSHPRFANGLHPLRIPASRGTTADPPGAPAVLARSGAGPGAVCIADGGTVTALPGGGRNLGVR
jgi:hypothetical protein